MKRRTRLLLVSGAVVGTFPITNAVAASAHPADRLVRVVSASGSPPRVHRVRAPQATRVTVAPGDTLSALGARTHRSWQALAAFNRIVDPNLILVGQVLTVPPVSYQPVIHYQPATHLSAVTHTVVVTTPTYTAPAPQPVSSNGGGGLWGCIAAHESGGNAGTNTGNGYYGAFQDTIGSWQAAGGGPGLPSDYSYATQLAVNQRIQSQQGWGAWPNTSAMCGA